MWHLLFLIVGIGITYLAGIRTGKEIAIVLVIGPFVWKAIQGGYDTILARFTKASTNADIYSWNKK
ncbi:hypothetical protein ACIKK6_06530 [Bacillus thuringiensis]|uniref:hypothetical protein n=1 Tax=Bacillus thuringiensis TaxID=1428 RepID=UPI0037CEE555